MPEEKKTSKKSAPKKTTTRRSSKKTAEPVEVLDQIQEAAPAEESLSAEIKNVKVVSLATVLPEEGLKIRKGPGTNFDKDGKVAAGTEVEVLDIKDDFVRIGHDQWVMKKYLGGI